jgi:hypothetical protein
MIMTSKIERFRFQSLDNAEFTIAVPHIVTIAEKYSVVSQGIPKRLEAVKAFLPDLDKIEAHDRKWRDAKTLDECERSRDAYVTIH